MHMTWQNLLLFIALIVLANCAPKGGFRLHHDYPSPPSIKRLTEPGACQGGDTLAALSLPLPKYPIFARRQGRQGWVVAKLDVLPNGQTDHVSVKQSAPEGVFDRSTVKAVRKWQFQPVRDAGLKNCLVFIDYRLGKVRIGR